MRRSKPGRKEARGLACTHLNAHVCSKETVCTCSSYAQSSQMVSRSRSPRLSAPQTLHLFLESLLPKPKVRPRSGTSKLERLWSPPSSRSAAAFNLAIRSASMASSSASGLSSMVSRDDMDGLRERIEVGVDGTDEEASEDGYCSLNLAGASRGEEAPEVGVLTVGVLVGGTPKGMVTWCRGDAGRRRRDREPVLLYRLATPGPARGVSSSSASSDMSHTLGEPSKEPSEAGRMPEPYRSWGPAVRGLGSSPRGLRVRLGERSGEEGRAVGEGDSVSWPVGCMTVGRECARVMGGALSSAELLCERRWERA